MPEKSILDARLAEIDRRLRTIQSGLAPAAEAEAVRGQDAEAVGGQDPEAVGGQDAEAVLPPEAAPVPLVPPEAAPVPQRLSEASLDRQAAELVAELRALVEAHQRLLQDARGRQERRPPAAAESWASVSAGPFAGTEALRRFEASLRVLPEVREVVVREFEGEDRAVIDVHLS